MAYKVANINDLFRVKSDGAIEFGTSGAGTDTYVLTSAGPNATPTWTEPTTGTVKGTGTATRVAFWSASDTITSDADLYWDNTNKRLGIGVTSPTEKLDVVGTGGNTNIRVYDSSGNSEVGIKLQGDAKTWTLQNWGSGGDNLRLLNNAGNTVQLWDDNGKVAIGNFNDPDRTLDVRGDGMSIYGTGDYTELMLRGQVEGTGTVRNVGAFHLSIRSDVGGDNDDLKFLRFVNGTYGGIAMQIQNTTGNVGIGTNGPTAPLMIAGSGADGTAMLRLEATGGTETFNWISSVIYPNLAAGKTAIKLFGQAQSTNNQAWMGFKYAGSGSTSNMLTFGFYANNFLVNLLANGNLGIGTDSPGSKLTVSGPSNAASNTPSQAIVDIVGSSTAHLLMGTASASPYGAWINTDATGQPLILQGPGGNVGIGTASPATELQIGDYTDATETITIATSNNGAGRINFYDQNDTEGGSIRVVGQSLGSKMYFSNRWNTDNDKVVFDLTAGNVGIGTTLPGNKLTIASGTGGGSAPDSRTLLHIDKDGEAYISINSPAESFNGIRLNVAGSPKAFMELYDNTAQGKKLNIGTIDARDLVFDTGNQPKMTILSGGNVGIGTTSPTAKLDISGMGTGGVGVRIKDAQNVAGSYYYGFMFDGTDIRGTTQSNIFYAGGSVLAGTTIATWASLRISTPYLNTGAAVTNNYAIYQESTLQKSYFAGNVGIGVTNPSSYWANANNLVVGGLGAVSGITIATDGNLTGSLIFADSTAASDNTRGGLQYNHSNDSMFFRVDNNLPMTILSSGNVGIGTTSPTARLNVVGVGQANNPTVAIDVTNSDSFNHGLEIFDGNLTTGETVLMAIGHSGSTKLTAIFGFIRNENSLDQNLATIGFWGADNKFTVSAGGNVGIGTGTGLPAYKLDVQGTIRATGDVIAYSDVRVKENIKTIDNSLEKVSKLRGVEFNKIGNNEKSIGVIAQEIEKVIPEVVKIDDKGMKSVAYGNISGLLIEAIKELKAEIEELKKYKCDCKR